MNKIDEMLGKIMHKGNVTSFKGFNIQPRSPITNFTFNPINRFVFSDVNSKNKKTTKPVTIQSLKDNEEDEVLVQLRTEFEKNPGIKVVPNEVHPLFSGLHPEYFVEKKIVTETKQPTVKKHTLLDDLMNRNRLAR